MKVEPAKESAIYPEFHLENLERYAVRWAKYLNGKYEHIRVDGIFLCRINTELEERMRSRLHKQWDTTKYAVVVEIIGCDGVDVKSVEFYPHENADESDKTLPEENYSDCQNFIAMVKFAGHYSAKHPFIDDAFERSVYREKPPGGVIREWKFSPKVKNADWKSMYSDEKSPLIHLDTVYVIYRAGRLPDGVLRTIEKAKPEIELFYENVKKGVDGSLSRADPKKKRTAALSVLERGDRDFKLIKETYLKEKDLYHSVAGGQEKRAFVGKLLRLVVYGEHSKKFPAYKLLEAYRQIPTGRKTG